MELGESGRVSASSLRRGQSFAKTAHSLRDLETERMTPMKATQDDAELTLIERARALLPAGGLGNIASDVIIARGLAGRV